MSCADNEISTRSRNVLCRQRNLYTLSQCPVQTTKSQRVLEMSCADNEISTCSRNVLQTPASLSISCPAVTQLITNGPYYLKAADIHRNKRNLSVDGKCTLLLALSVQDKQTAVIIIVSVCSHSHPGCGYIKEVASTNTFCVRGRTGQS